MGCVWMMSVPVMLVLYDRQIDHFLSHQGCLNLHTLTILSTQVHSLAESKNIVRSDFSAHAFKEVKKLCAECRHLSPTIITILTEK